MKIKDMIFNIVIGVLCVVLVITIAAVAFEFHDITRIYKYDEDRFLYALQYEEYDNMLRCMKENEVNNVKTTETMEECYAIARYYEAVFYYKAYMEAGETEKAAEKAEIMEIQAEKMGQLSYAEEDIRESLGLDE